MDNQPLTREIVPDTALMQLNMRISPDSLDVMLYNPLEDRSLIYRHADLPSNDDERLKAVEDFIYDNPVLTSEFHKTNVILSTNRFTILPDEVTDTELIERALKAACPENNTATETLINRIDELKATIVSAPSARMVNFIRRTFLNAPILHSLVPLARYFGSRWGAGAPPRMLVNMRPGSMDVVVTDGNGLRYANTLSYREPNDAVYYIVALCHSLDNKIEEILLAGDRELRDKLNVDLRKHHNYVMPMIFPSAMFRAGANAMNIPFDLVIMPLCE